MIIDFKEIAVSNKGGQHQDLFEQFACDFLESVGYKIIRRPDRGPDGKKDLIISESRVGINGETTINWLVSCKHNAHSNKSVNDTDEQDIYDRVLKHNCQGFLGFYSTVLASSLLDKLYALRDRIEFTTYDSTRIEKELLSNNNKYRLLASYFPLSYQEYKKEKLDIETSKINAINQFEITEEDILRITKTAIILLDIEKIKYEDYGRDWLSRGKALEKFYRFSNHSNEKVATSIFDFLSNVSLQTRSNMTSDIAGTIHSLILTFLTAYQHPNNEEEIYLNAKKCANIGFNLIYDSIVYLHNYRITEYGLSIWKYIHIEIPELSDFIVKQYEKIEWTLNRPNRDDLENGKEIIRIFKDDLNNNDLKFPVLPDHLYKLVEQSK